MRGPSLTLEKMLISTRCVCGFMPNLHKKSWIVSDIHGVKINHFLQRMGWKWKARIWFILAGLLTISASIFPLSSRNDLILLDRLKEAQSPSQYAPKRLAIRFQQHQFRSISGDTIILARRHNYRDDLITDSKFSAIYTITYKSRLTQKKIAQKNWCYF